METGLQPARGRGAAGKDGMSAKDENSYRYCHGIYYWLPEEFGWVTGLSWTLSLLHIARSSGFPAVLGSQRLPWSASGAEASLERGALSLPFSFNQICFPWIQGFEWRHCLKTTFLYWRFWNERPTEWNSVPPVSVREPNFLIWLSLTLWMSWASSGPIAIFLWRPPCSYVSVCSGYVYCSSSLSFLDTFLINHLPLTRAYTFL